MDKRMSEYLDEYSNIVKKLIMFYEQQEHFDDYMGWMTGLNTVNETKSYHAMNLKNYLKERSQTTYCPSIDYVNLYLQFPEIDVSFPTVVGYVKY